MQARASSSPERLVTKATSLAPCPFAPSHYTTHSERRAERRAQARADHACRPVPDRPAAADSWRPAKRPGCEDAERHGGGSDREHRQVQPWARGPGQGGTLGQLLSGHLPQACSRRGRSGASKTQMLVDDIGDVTVTNDGATILKLLEVEHPAAKVRQGKREQPDHDDAKGTDHTVPVCRFWWSSPTSKTPRSATGPPAW